MASHTESEDQALRQAGRRLPRRERRRQLLDAALGVFVSQGYHAAAMDEIAERAGVSKPVLYQHFPGKLELYLALLDESVDTLVETVRDALRSTPDPKQRVAATFGAYFDYVGGEGAAYRLLFESDLSNEPAVRERLERVQRECAEMVSQALREDAGLSVDEAHLLSVGMVGMAQVTARYWLSTRDHIPREAAEQLVARLAWRGISGWPRTETSQAVASGGAESTATGAFFSAFPVQIYLENEAAAPAVEESLNELLRELGFVEVDGSAPVLGSWHRKFTLGFKKACDSEAMSEARRFAEIQLLDRFQAGIDAATGDAVSKLILALNNTRGAVLQVGSVLLVKVDDTVVVRQLTVREMLHWQQNPGLFKDPSRALGELQRAFEKSESELSPDRETEK
jgi:AcrR family transcriptional regulator